MIHYEGIFLDEKSIKIVRSLEKTVLDEINDEIHLTLKYKPVGDEVFNELLNKEFDLYLTGYGNDRENSGFEVMLPDELKPYYINYDEDNPKVLKIPHITSSIKTGAISSNTKKLKFRKLDKPVKVHGRFGFWIKEIDKEYAVFNIK